ncbi:hypothetical protein GH714_007278 [Hevea brasiliensis]|uniref:peptidylprolyl isomerase n=1 Tax=Hevea brasiliensis TaxID=3981 RepID=A0A6A6KHN3_HEVBR|nr:hypothetical protein GH714_007278 [Hevea brasiliensis]
MSYTRDIGRREVVILSVGLVSGALWNASIDGVALASEFADSKFCFFFLWVLCMQALPGNALLPITSTYLPIAIANIPFINPSSSSACCEEAKIIIASNPGKDYGKSKMRYPDYTETDSGLQFKDLRVGDGPKPKMGETVVVDWDGYTIGYYGRIFEARNKTKGGSFEGNEKDFFKFKLGSGEVIPAFEEAVSGMALGGVRRKIMGLAGPKSLGFCVEEPGTDRQNSAV